MKDLFEPATADELKQRIGDLHADSQRQWGKMNPAQALAHCATGLEMALGTIRPPRVFIGRLLGPFIKTKAIAGDQPFRRSSPTSSELIIRGERNFEAERLRLCALIDRFVAGPPSICTTHPHPFFGPLTPTEWAILNYKHLDHHLRQFGV